MEITFSEDVLDSRDIQERFDELTDELDALQSELEDLVNELEDMEDDDDYDKDDIENKLEEKTNKEAEIEEWKEDNEEEYELLKECIDKFGDYGDWQYGETLIHEDYWVKYCEELCKDIGDIPSDLPWYIADHIDWEGVAKEIAIDYMAETIKGNTYYMRSC